MVERQPELTRPQAPRPAGRGPSRGELARRRAFALALIAGGIALAVWLATLAVRSIGGGPSKVVTVVPPPKPLKIVFPEGFTRAEMAERITAVDGIAKRRRGVTPRLSAQQYLAATARSHIPGRFAHDRTRRSLEGFLFPATYEFTAKTTSRQLVAVQLAAFRKNWAKVNLAQARKKHLTPYDVLIIASMIEKETLAPDERSLVSAVIYNRLRARMPLGIDATVRYGLGVPPTQSLRASELNNPTPYNTRVHRGLPPTPIGNPGLASIQAATHPAKIDYLYFVRKPDKVHHFFTSSFREFQRYAKAHGYG